ncbi:MAG TPA: CehA/McbA family metallohydrolase [Bacillota bacterium]|nr:CehA/McbA family metallohydrolase [Bacillota bacterium]
MFIPDYEPSMINNYGRWQSVDLHVHSIYSGASLTPLEILNSAGAAFLDAVAISDHNEVRGAIEGQIITGSTVGLPVVLSSQEVSAGEHCHFLLVGSTRAQADVNRSKLPEVLQKHRETGGVVILAHPWTTFKNNWFRGLCRELIAGSLLDGMELCNASVLELPRSVVALVRKLWEEWVIPNRLAVVGGSDYHYRNKERKIGLGRTYLKVYEPGEKGLLDALRNRRCVAGLFGGPEIDFPGVMVGGNFYLGQEPWWGELQDLINVLRYRVAQRERFDSRAICFLLQLIAAGHFQAVADLLV